jgi:N-glycosylase/DNA lyase
VKAKLGTYREVEELLREFAERQEGIRQRLEEFTAVPPEEYFYELVYCLLTPQSSAVHAAGAVEALRGAGFPEERTLDLAAILGDRAHYIRFHHTKARRLREAHESFGEIQPHLAPGRPPREVRDWLASRVKGFGLKESSHFLRNIGHRDLAILDRHILKNLVRHGVLRSLPGSLTARRYRAIEERFARFAAAVGISMDELDLLFWSRETGDILK